MVVCRSGLGDGGSLRWSASPTPDQDRQIDDLLRKTYGSIVARLQSQRALLDRVAAALEQRQELSGNELRQLVADVT
jgi:hypothetical protein